MAAEGLVTIRENRRSYVTDLTEDEFEQAFDVASMLESYSAGLAAARLTEDDLQKLRETGRPHGEPGRGTMSGTTAGSWNSTWNSIT